MFVSLESSFEISTRVGRGVAFLDTEYPGWREKIDVDLLDIQLGNCCALGQLYGSYRAGEYKLRLNEVTAGRLGFFAKRAFDFKSYILRYIEYFLLTRAWKRALLVG